MFECGIEQQRNTINAAQYVKDGMHLLQSGFGMTGHDDETCVAQFLQLAFIRKENCRTKAAVSLPPTELSKARPLGFVAIFAWCSTMLTAPESNNQAKDTMTGCFASSPSSESS